MASYSKKTEPLTRYEATMVGITLILWMLILSIAPMIALYEWYEAVFDLSPNNIKEMEKFHNIVQDDKWEILSVSTIWLIGYPIILSHMHYIKRFYQTFGSFAKLDLMVSLYINSWFMVAIILCIIVPALLIFVTYYDWKFHSDFQYVGHVMQFQMSSLVIHLIDASVVPMGIAASLPWVALFWGILGFNRSSYWELPMVAKEGGVKAALCYAKIWNLSKSCRIIFALFFLTMALITLFGSFGDSFDYDTKGFFSYHGESQFLATILFISWSILAIIHIYIGCNLDRIQRLMDASVKPIPLSQQGDKTDDRDDDDDDNDKDVGGSAEMETVQTVQSIQQSIQSAQSPAGGVEN